MTNKNENLTPLEIKAELIILGYEVKTVNIDCFDSEQNGRVYYLSFKEGCALKNAEGEHPLTLSKHHQIMGNRFTF